MKLKVLLAGLLGSMLVSSAAFATDRPQLITPPPLPVVVVPPAPSFNWAGAYVSAAYQRGAIVQGAVGFNVVRSRVVLGAELLGGYSIGGGGLSVGLGLRAGVLVGDRDRLLLYASGRLYWVPGTSFFPMTFDVGAEFRLTDRLSVFAEGGLYASFEGGVGLGCCGSSLHAGVTFRLGR
ncbi:MAG: hypothetical protein KIT43_04400 [Bauldia sp.]|nr:hypothetical protein [Bauldia sp.]